MTTTTHILPRPFGSAHLPPSSFPNDASSHPSPAPTLITQGAEALIYKTHFLTADTPCALKHRPSKSYRHPILDARLTKARILAEARVLVRCRREGVRVPAVLGLDWDAGWMAQEWIEGRTIRACLDEYLHGVDEGGEDELEDRRELWALMDCVGRAVGKMHGVGVVHGDLTTSNLMLRPRQGGAGQTDERKPETGTETTQEQRQDMPPPQQPLTGDIVLIDFGLAVQSIQDEDRAVDLYVLERAFGSTHPQAAGLFGAVLQAYGDSYKGARNVLRRLDDVRLRGRKKSMVG